MGDRVDVHHHVLPEFYVAVQRAHGITGSAYRGFPEWSARKSLDLMAAHDIRTAILSFTSPGIWFGDVAETRGLARRCNDFLAELADRHPGRFGGFATLPLPDVDAAIAEAGRALDELGLDGVTLLTSVDDRYVGHPDFEPLYEELDRRRAVVFVHPRYPPGVEAKGWDIPRMLVDYPFETTKAAVNLIFKGVMERLPRIRFVLSHAGGTLPFLAHRIAGFDGLTSFAGNFPEGAMAYVRRFWFDTALSGGALPLAALHAVADPSRILFGSDYPYVSEDRVAAETAGLDGWEGMTGERRAAIDRENAAALLPRRA